MPKLAKPRNCGVFYAWTVAFRIGKLIAWKNSIRPAFWVLFSDVSIILALKNKGAL
jgi:hypothetical protein